MAYSIISSPSTWASAHSQALFTVFDSTKPQTPGTYPDYKYIAQVYIGGVQVAKLKAFPEPDTLAGVFDVGPIIRSYLSSNFNPDTQIIGNEYQPWIEAQVRFGEEYGGTEYLNLTNTTGKYFDTYKTGPWTSTSVLDTKANTFASSRPAATYLQVDSDTDYVLVPYFATASGTVAYSIEFLDATNEFGTLNATGTVTNPSGIVHFNIAKSIIDAATSANTIEASINVSGQVTRVRYTCGRFNARTIAFLNKYGGYETYDFRMVSRESLDIERRGYQSEPYRLGPSGQVSYQSGARYYGRRATYGSQVRHRLQVTSDWLSDAEYEWLRELAASTETFLLVDGVFVPCSLQASEYRVRTGAADRLTTLELVVDFDLDYNGQFR